MNILSKYEIHDKITKGFSKDDKYHVVDKLGNHYLIRIFPINRYKDNLERFENMKQAYKYTKSMCEPVEIGYTGETGYLIQTWVMGDDAIEKVEFLSDKQLYSIGFSSGKILAQIHQVTAPLGLTSWKEKYNAILEKRIENYLQCPLKYKNGDAFIQYCRTHRHLLQNRPQTFRHGDYHIGNLILDNQNMVSIIDFGLSDYGDPWEEFNRIIWTAQKSPMLATGMINGYFNNCIPNEFWELLVLYLYSKALYALPWSLAYGEEETNIIINQSFEIFEWYGGMKEIIPSWYNNSITRLSNL